MDSVNDELQRRINEHVLNGDAPSIIWAMEGQIRINTELEARLAELERREALLTAFVVADDRTQALYPERWQDDWPDDLWAAVNEAADARLSLDWIPQP
jgi:hypothetical protein